MRGDISLLISLLFFTSAIGIVSALHGVVYTIHMEPASHTIISFYHNKTLVARVVSNETGAYSVDLPAGSYLAIAYTSNTSLMSNESILVSAGNQEYDIILAPSINVPSVYGMGQLDLPGLGYIDVNQNNPIPKQESQDNNSLWYFTLFFVFALVSLVLYLVFMRRTRSRLKSKDVGHLLKIIITHCSDGKPIPQSSLVDITGWSEAKVSIILKQLEKEGRVKRKKVGRRKYAYLIDTHHGQSQAHTRDYELV